MGEWENGFIGYIRGEGWRLPPCRGPRRLSFDRLRAGMQTPYGVHSGRRRERALVKIPCLFDCRHGECCQNSCQGEHDQTSGSSSPAPAKGEQINGGPIVDAVVCRLAGIGDPAPAARSLQSERIADQPVHRRSRRNAFGQRGCANAEFQDVPPAALENMEG